MRKGSQVVALMTPVPVTVTEAFAPPMLGRTFSAAATAAAFEPVGIEAVVKPLKVSV